MSHTQGKLRIAKDVQDWSVSNDECCSTCYTDLTSESGKVIALVVAGEKSVHADPDPRPDARRLVACWNACDGIRTMDLEMDNVLFTEALNERSALKARRDELLAALTLIRDAENSALDLAYCKGIARAAIANTKGEK